VLPVHDHSGIVFKTYSTRPDVVAFVKGVTAAATGAIRDAVIVLGRRAVVDIPTVVRMPSTLALVWKVKNCRSRCWCWTLSDRADAVSAHRTCAVTLRG
jgi:hypothetical protein